VVCASARSPQHATRKSCCAGDTVRAPEATPGVDLESLSEAHLERLYAGFVRLASMDETVLAALVEHVLAVDQAGLELVVLARDQEDGRRGVAPRRARDSGALSLWYVRRVRPYGNNASERPRRGVKWSQVAVPRIGPRTNLHPPTASGGNMYLQRAHLTPGVGAGR
jgi:hypothetical protein